MSDSESVEITIATPLAVVHLCGAKLIISILGNETGSTSSFSINRPLRGVLSGEGRGGGRASRWKPGKARSGRNFFDYQDTKLRPFFVASSDPSAGTAVDDNMYGEWDTCAGSTYVFATPPGKLPGLQRAEAPLYLTLKRKSLSVSLSQPTDFSPLHSVFPPARSFRLRFAGSANV